MCQALVVRMLNAVMLAVIHHVLVFKTILEFLQTVDPNVSSILNVQVVWLAYGKNAGTLVLAHAE